VKVVYIAGPFRGASSWKIETNVRAAEAVALEIFRMGHVPICPHTGSRFFFGELDEQVVLEGCLELLRRADLVIFLPGWEASEGTRIERVEAIKSGIPAFYSLRALELALDDPLRG